ncbi:MAG: hypothetical protein ACI9MC_003213 [Kiritimatiellia bacterium]|jgi:hypothetical protein
MRTSPVLLILLCVGCTAPPAPPQDLSQLLLTLFRDAQPADQDAEKALVAALTELDEVHLPSFDLESPIGDRAVSPARLTAEWRDGFEVPSGLVGDDLEACSGTSPSADCEAVQEQAQVPLAVLGLSPHPLSAHLNLIVDDNQACIDADSVKFARRSWTDGPCLLDGGCSTTQSVTAIRTKSLIADIWYDQHHEHHLTALADDRQVLVSRGWTERVWWSDRCTQSWDQSFTLDLWIPDAEDPSQTQRVYAIWSSVHLNGISEDLFVRMLRQGAGERFDNTDAMLDGDVCGWRDDEHDRADDVDAACVDGGGA